MREVNHIIGSTRTLATAILVVEWLREHAPLKSKVHKDLIRYRPRGEVSEASGWWFCDIIIVSNTTWEPPMEVSGEYVRLCMAFVAGRGEIW